MHRTDPVIAVTCTAEDGTDDAEAGGERKLTPRVSAPFQTGTQSSNHTDASSSRDPEQGCQDRIARWLFPARDAVQPC